MTMMATQEPTDPSVLLNSSCLNNSNSNTTNNNMNGDMLTTTAATSTTNNHANDTSLLLKASSNPTTTENGTDSQLSALGLPLPTSTGTPSAATAATPSHHSIMSATRTPPRSSLANDPNLTPIASIKRPRAAANQNKANSNRSTPNQMMLMSPMSSKADSALPSATTTPNSGLDDATPLSPMHKIKPVLHRAAVAASTTHHTPDPVQDKVDELFSPVVQFLHEHDVHHQAEYVDAAALDHLNDNDDDDDDDDDVEEEHIGIHASRSDGTTPHYNTDDDDDISMSRPEPHDEQNHEGEFNPWQFIAALPPYESVVAYRPPITLPPLVERNISSSLPSPPLPRKTLVLDLDETLVHCSVTEPADQKVDFTFPVQFHGETYSVHVKCRPYLQQFLQEMCQHFEVIVFTASQKVYADALLNILDPHGRYIHHRLFRESCLAVEGNYLKDLNVLGRDLHRTVLVDNSPHAFGYQVSNGIPIESWFDCPNDRELIKLQRFLLSQVLPAEDVRVPVRNKFQSHILIATAPPFPS